MKRCDFCDEFTGGYHNSYVSRYGRGHDRVVAVGGQLRVVPSLGQIAEGHLLIAPLTHFCAMADLPKKQIVELDQLCRHVRSVLCRVFGDCVLFEHGIRGQGSGGCGIDHAHMHAVPVVGNGVLNVLKREFGGCEIERLTDMRKSIDKSSSYLFFEDSSTRRYLFPVKKLPSQYMRKLVAESIGKSDWDWRASGQEPELISTIRHLRPVLSPGTVAHGG